jgi:hypothetical protein
MDTLIPEGDRMTVPSFSDWAKMYDRTVGWIPKGREHILDKNVYHKRYDRMKATRDYILLRIQRKEEAWKERQGSIRESWQDLVQKLKTQHENELREYAVLNGVPYPPDSQSALTEINQKED